MAVKLGDPQTKKLTTGRLFYTPLNDVQGAIDLGNVLDHKYDPAIDRIKHKAAQNGLMQVDLNLVKGAELKYVFTLDEITIELLKLMFLGTQAADVTQASGNITAESLTTNSKGGRTYFAAARGLSAYAVKVTAVTKTEGVDYTIDAGSGAITILASGTIADASTVTIDYTKAQIVTQPVTLLKFLLAQGTFKFVEKDQFAANPRAIHDFSGQAQVMDWGENTMEDVTKIKLEVLATGNPVISFRKD
jgi:hypothetical protein